MTLVIGIKTKDGIIIQSDTKFTNEDNYTEEGCKVFEILSSKQATFMFGFSHRKDWIPKTLQVLREKFSKSSKRAPISEGRLEQLLKECKNEQLKEINRDSKAREDKIGINIPFVGFVAGRIMENNDEKFVLYNYQLNQEPFSHDILAIGAVDIEAYLIIDKIIPALLNRIGLTWLDLPSNFVAQLVFFTMRFVSRNNSSVGSKLNGYIINEKGWKSYSLEQFFPSHFDTNKKTEYIYEILETALNTIGSSKIQEGFDIELIFKIFTQSK